MLDMKPLTNTKYDLQYSFRLNLGSVTRSGTLQKKKTERKFARGKLSQLVKQVRELFKSPFFCSISPDDASLELRTEDSAVKGRNTQRF